MNTHAFSLQPEVYASDQLHILLYCESVVRPLDWDAPQRT